jgi:hypothetical protein
MAAYKKHNTGLPATDGTLPSGTTKAATTSTASNGISTPKPIQSGMVSNCNKFHVIKSTTTCQGIADYSKIPITDFFKWNPGVKDDCSNLVLGAHACASVIASTSQPVATTAGNGISTPMPVQSGMVSNCNKFHPIKSTTTCQGIADYHKISISDFFKWNPGVKTDCSNLVLGANACAGVIASTSTTTTSNGVSTPPAIQSGMVSDCNKFHLIRSTTTCQGIVDYNKITMDNLLKWNPSINSKCSNLELGSSVCVGVIEGQASPSSPTKTATGIVTPTPTQTGMINGCTKFHPVKSTTTCQGILD